MATAKAKKVVRSRRRVDLDAEEEAPAASSYFASVEKEGVSFISSGCAGIDAALGGGWPCGRIVNIVGDKSAGKTLLAIEAVANFHIRFPKGGIRYGEAEAAFDKPYAEAIGLPRDVVEFTGDGIRRKKKKTDPDQPDDIHTVEDVHDDLEAFLDRQKGKGPCLYVVDSLDALSDEAEQGREIGESSYGGNKPKKIGEMFRRLVQRIEEQQCLVIIISQLRDKLNVTFGETKTRSGGRALDFYATHIVWLAETGKVKKTIDGIERVIGVEVKARVKKNKVGLAHREFDYCILFGYGIDDLTANIEWLILVGALDKLDALGFSKSGYKVRVNALRNRGGDEARETRAALRKLLFAEWEAIEKKFLPKASKY